MLLDNSKAISIAAEIYITHRHKQKLTTRYEQEIVADIGNYSNETIKSDEMLVT